MTQLEQKLVSELPLDALVVSNAFPLPSVPASGAHDRRWAATGVTRHSEPEAGGHGAGQTERRARVSQRAVLERVSQRWVETDMLSPDNSSSLYVYRVAQHSTGPPEVQAAHVHGQVGASLSTSSSLDHRRSSSTPTLIPGRYRPRAD